jgi:hypothetical protein
MPLPESFLVSPSNNSEGNDSALESILLDYFYGDIAADNPPSDAHRYVNSLSESTTQPCVSSAFAIPGEPLSQPRISSENYSQGTARPEVSVLESLAVVYYDHPELLVDRLPPHTRPPDPVVFGSLDFRERFCLPDVSSL